MAMSNIFKKSQKLGHFVLRFVTPYSVTVENRVPRQYAIPFTFLFAAKLLSKFPEGDGRAISERAERWVKSTRNKRTGNHVDESFIGLCARHTCDIWRYTENTFLHLYDGDYDFDPELFLNITYSGMLVQVGEELMVKTEIAKGDEDSAPALYVKRASFGVSKPLQSWDLP